MKPASDFSCPAAFLITAAGSGKRMGLGEKKEFRKINGIPVLAFNLNAVLRSEIFSCGVITVSPGTIEKTLTIIEPLKGLAESLGVSVYLCDGGSERQKSVHFGLQYLADKKPGLLDDGIVLIHDGARPWASSELIRRVAEGCRDSGGCAPVIPPADAMKTVSADGFICGHLNRKNTLCVQTPQGFGFRQILEAHEKAAADGNHYIDDTEIYSRYGGMVAAIAGERDNRKITYAEDLAAYGERETPE